MTNRDKSSTKRERKLTESWRQRLRLIWQLSNYVKRPTELQCGGQRSCLRRHLNHTHTERRNTTTLRSRENHTITASWGQHLTADWGPLSDMTDRCCALFVHPIEKQGCRQWSIVLTFPPLPSARLFSSFSLVSSSILILSSFALNSDPPLSLPLPSPFSSPLLFLNEWIQLPCLLDWLERPCPDSELPWQHNRKKFPRELHNPLLHFRIKLGF